MQVIVADKLSSFVAGRLQDLGARVHVDPLLRDEALSAALGEIDPDVLVVRSTEVTARHIGSARALALIVRAGAGVNTIDLDAASQRGIYVANCPGKNAAAVAELTIGHLINLDRRIADNVMALRRHEWNKKGFGGARGLAGRTLAILGCGTIGRAVASRAQALGMHVVAWSYDMDPETAAGLGIEHASTPEDAVGSAHAVTVHLALTPETTGRISESVFRSMRPDAYFINTSRGAIVDQDALRAAISERGIRVGLDVYRDEPAGGSGTFDDAIADEPNVYGTHHIGASTLQAEEAVGEEVVRIVESYALGRPIPSCVNLSSTTGATHCLVVRHADRVGVLAHVMEVLREGGHNVQEMQNIVFSGSAAACARIAVVGQPSAGTLRKIATGPEVFSVSAAALQE